MGKGPLWHPITRLRNELLTSAPKAAVVIPCYNAQHTIANTIRSVQDQTISDWELVVIDDGSSDGSAQVVQEIAAQDPRVRLISQENAGVSTARNAGFAATTAPLIGLVDADDLWKPTFLERMMAAFDQDDQLGVAFCRAEILDELGDPTGTTTTFSDTATDVEELLLTNPAGTCSTLMIRRNVLDDVGPFATELRRVEDQHWMLKARLGGWVMRGLDEVLVGYRTSGDGLSANLEGMLEGWEAMIEMLGDQVPADQVRRARAEHYLYLTRRAVRLGRPPAVGLGYLTQAVKTDPKVALNKVASIPGALGRRFGSGEEHVEEEAELEDLEKDVAVEKVSMTPLEDGSPVVSVIVPIYGAEKWIKGTVESVLAQTYTDFELVLIDDGSPDRSIEICEGFDDPRIRIVRQKNRGLPGARNTGIRHAKGQLLAFLDADDLWRSDKLAKHVQHFEERPHVDVGYSASRLIDESDQPIGIVQMPKLRDVTVRDVICRNPIGNGSAPVIRRWVFDAIAFDDDRHGTTESHYFDEDFRYAEDVECWTRIAGTTDAVFEGLADELTDYRVISGSLSSGTDQHYEHWLRHYKKVEEYAPVVAATHGEAARGYQMRFYARRDLQAGSPRTGLRWFKEAFKAHPMMLVEETQKTVLTFAAVVAGNVLPAKIFDRLLAKVMGGGGAANDGSVPGGTGGEMESTQRTAA